jgi:hypothetical protein
MTQGSNRWNYPENIATMATTIGSRQYLPKNEFKSADFPEILGPKTK